ncbi:MAG: cysteine desulfurase, partial [Gemmatimonadaceae bacterium]|nr:cysteine desulfurase [Gemmatimonadaceae bacterium]
VTSPIEHKAVLAAVHQAAREGADERIVPVTADGVVDLAATRQAIASDTAIASVMWINNETGAVQPIQALAEHAKSVGAVFHTDAVQAFGKVTVDARVTPFDFCAVSGHKCGAPKGIGAFFIRRGTALEPLFFGGSQDRGRRPGTENVASAVALATAMELTLKEKDTECARLRTLLDRLEAALIERLPDAVIHARGAERAPHIINISVPGTDSESMLMALDLQGVAASSGSACQSGSVTPSHVLAAMGVRTEIANAAIRMSLGSLTTDEDVQRVSDLFPALIGKARGLAGVL